MKLRTKILSLAMAATMLTGVVAGAASTTWVFDAYDLNHPLYLKIEKELDEMGYPTRLWRYGSAPSTIEWKHAFYEKDYPYTQVQQLYLDGMAQERYQTTSSVGPRVEKTLPVYWEACAPYAIYGQVWSQLPGVTNWALVPDWDSRFSGKNLVFMGNASVTRDWVDYGFSAYRTVYGAFVDTANFLATRVGAGKFQHPADFTAVMTSYAAIQALDLNNPANAGVTAWPATTVLGVEVPRLDQEELTGPKYEGGNVVGTKAVRAIDELMSAKPALSDYDATLLVNELRKADVTWTYAGYEKEAHHRIYQYLTIDGVVMDGGDCLQLLQNTATGDWYLAPAKKPLIKRYTDGWAAPYLYGSK